MVSSNHAKSLMEPDIGFIYGWDYNVVPWAGLFLLIMRLSALMFEFDGLASHPAVSRNTLSRLMLHKPEYVKANWAVWSGADFAIQVN